MNPTLVVAVVLGGALLVAACYYVPMPKSLGRRIGSNGLIHSVKAEYLKPGTDGGQRLQRWPCGLVFFLGPVVCLYARRRLPWWERKSAPSSAECWATVIVEPGDAQVWLAEHRVWLRLVDRAVVVSADYDGPATVNLL